MVIIRLKFKIKMYFMGIRVIIDNLVLFILKFNFMGEIIHLFREYFTYVLVFIKCKHWEAIIIITRFQ